MLLHTVDPQVHVARAVKLISIYLRPQTYQSPLVHMQTISPNTWTQTLPSFAKPSLKCWFSPLSLALLWYNVFLSFKFQILNLYALVQFWWRNFSCAAACVVGISDDNGDKPTQVGSHSGIVRDGAINVSFTQIILLDSAQYSSSLLKSETVKRSLFVINLLLFPD